MDKTPRELLVEKLLNDENIVQADIAALDMFNRRYIKLLMQLPQSELKMKLAHMLVTPSVTEFKAKSIAYV